MSKPIRVAMIIQQYYPRIGGAESQLSAIAPILQTLNIQVHVITRRYPGLAAFEHINHIPVHRLPILGPKPTASLGFTLAALPLLRRLAPTVIHAHELFSPTTTAVIAKRLLRSPVVVTVHRSGKLGEIERLKHKMLGIQRLATFKKYVDAFVVISEEIDRELTEAGIAAERRVFIPNAVDTNHFAPLGTCQKSELRSKLGLSDAPTAIYAGRLASEKRLDLLIGIWQAVRDRIPNAQLVLVGQGKSEAHLRRKSGAGIKFVGITHDVVPYLQAADLFVLPSSAEGLSVAILEAMAVELPVLATAIGGNLQLIRHGETGWLIPPNDAPALRDAVIQLLSDPSCRAALKTRARAQVIQKYELSATAQKLFALYDRLQKGDPLDA